MQRSPVSVSERVDYVAAPAASDLCSGSVREHEGMRSVRPARRLPITHRSANPVANAITLEVWMKIRHAFHVPDVTVAAACVRALRARGVQDADISLIAGSRTLLEQLPESLKDDSPTDFVPAAMRGAVGGGGVGLLAGLVAAAIPPLGITVAGAAFMAIAGAAVGTWSSSLMGAAISSEVHRRFEERLGAGELLLVLDAEEDRLAMLEADLVRCGGRRVDYEAVTALT